MNINFLLKSFPFPWLVISDGTVLDEGKGSLFKLSHKAESVETKEHCQVASLGWSVCPKGYAVYAKPIDKTRKLVVYGLKIRGVSTAKGKETSLSIKLDKPELEEHVTAFFRAANTYEEHFNAIINSNIHEIRSISAYIYHAAEELNHSLEGTAETEKIKNIIGLSDTLKRRIDFMDVLTNSSTIAVHGGKIPVYKVFDKVKRSLFTQAKNSNIELKINGASEGRIEATKIFDQIPFLILDNAIKYSPDHELILINIREDESTIYIQVGSLGPKVEINEYVKIFESGYRGENAKKTLKPGDGVGLYFVRKLVEDNHQGSIQFHQDDEVQKTMEGVPYCQTYFNLKFPRAD